MPQASDRQDDQCGREGYFDLGRSGNLQSLELSGCPDIGKLEEIARSVSLKKITASFPQFALLKDRFVRKIDFSTMTGSMTDEEEEIWYEYVRA